MRRYRLCNGCKLQCDDDDQEEDDDDDDDDDDQEEEEEDDEKHSHPHPTPSLFMSDYVSLWIVCKPLDSVLDCG